MVSLWGVQRHQVPTVWPAIKPLIQKVCDRGSEYTPEEIAAGLFDRELQLWLAWRGGDILSACVTEIYDTEEETICSLLMCGGDDMRDWLHFIDTLEAWAYTVGADVCQIVGRRGWGRVLKGYEYAGRKGPDFIWRKVINDE